MKHALIFPLAYLSLTSSLTMLLILVGASGNGELAADLALIHGAALATFYALSGNTRSLILQRHAELTPRRIFQLRLVSLPVIFLAATALSAGVAEVPLAFALLIVARRASEWLAEVRLCELEVSNDYPAAVRALAVQGLATAATAFVLTGLPVLATAALGLYAVSPLSGLTLAYFRRDRLDRSARFAMIRSISPYVGSTAMEGAATYLLRLVVVLVAGRAMAGLLFTAYLIGSFAATIFGNVLAATFALRSSAGGAWPRLLTRRLALVMLVLGAAVCAASLTSGLPDWLGRPGYFWLSIGASLVGGSVMVLAQTIRARVFERQRGDVLFGPDVLRNIALIVAVPAMFHLLSPTSLAYVYLLSAAVTLLLYWLSQLYLVTGRRSDAPQWAFAAIAALLVLPLFFFVTGEVYHTSEALLKTGGTLMSVPLPVSLIVCALGIVLLIRYGEAVVGFGTIFFMFVCLTFTSIIATQGDVADQSRKFLLLFQFLIPALALVLGELFGASTKTVRRVGIGFLCVVAVIVPPQLIHSITGHQNEGNFLSHDLWLFSIYQHTQYVATIFVCAYAAATLALWEWRPLRKAHLVLAPLMAAYAAASFSITAVACLIGAALLLLMRWWPQRAARWYAGLIVVTVGVFFVLAKDSALLREKMDTTPAAVAARLSQAPPGSIDGEAIKAVPGPLQTRLFYWKLYASQIPDSWKTIFFGHRDVIDRTVAPSAHNYYLDFVYNFGSIALLPLLWLLFYTLSLLWRMRTRVWADAGVLGLSFVMIFAVAIDSMVKVPLRQPYSGVFLFFVWGLLIAQLRGKSAGTAS